MGFTDQLTFTGGLVSMESGLEDRNNVDLLDGPAVTVFHVSMESGLEDRNNAGRRPRS